MNHEKEIKELSYILRKRYPILAEAATMDIAHTIICEGYHKTGAVRKGANKATKGGK